MLGSYVQLHMQAQQAMQRMTGRVTACTYPLLYCQGGAVTGYALDGYVCGQRQKQTFYFDATWQPLTAAPMGAQPCCTESTVC